MKLYTSMTAMAGLIVALALTSCSEPSDTADRGAIDRTADEAANPVERKLLLKEAMPNLEGHDLTAVTVALSPGVMVPAHRHDGFVFVYVLEGIVQSQLDSAETETYHAGDSWVEPPGVLHTLTRNASNEDSAKILAVFVAKSDARLTTSGKISKQ